MHGDRVVAEVVKEATDERRAEGKILRIVKREITEVVGTFQKCDARFAFVVPDSKRLTKDVYVPKSGFNGATTGDKVVCKITLYARFAFVVPDSKRLTKDVYVPKSGFNGATTGDKVVCKITLYPRAGKKPEGVVTEVIGKKGDRYVEIDSIVRANNLPDDFPKKVQREAEQITAPTEADFEGRLDGKKGDRYVEIDSIVRANNLPDDFPKKVQREAEQITAPTEADFEGRLDLRDWNIFTIDGDDAKDLDDAISIEKKVQREAEQITAPTEADFEGRLDLRDWNIFTIDGDDAKDLDDAISIEKLKNGNYKLGVHIADVSHYVTEGSKIDKEALKRATSVYLVDKVIPMLPKELSNGVCSLNRGEDKLALSVIMEIDKHGTVVDHDIRETVIEIPMLPKELSNGVCSLNRGEDKLALSVIMEIDKHGTVVDHDIRETVIDSKARMTYTEVSDILEKNDEKLCKTFAHLVDDFRTAEELARILMDKRDRRGAIDFNFPESKIVLDSEGIPVDIEPYERRIANRMIEEFMLVTNETVAEHFYWLTMPFVYRIHENPSDEKMATLGKFISSFGYKVNNGKDEEVHPKALQTVLKKIAGKPEESAISAIMLRSLRQARYSPNCEGLMKKWLL